MHRILRPPPRQFPRTTNFMHLLTHVKGSYSRVRVESTRRCLYRRTRAAVCRVTRSKQPTEKEKATKRMKRNGQPEVSPAALRPFDLSYGWVTVGPNQSAEALLPAVPRTDSNVIRVICGPTSGRSQSETKDPSSQRAAAYNNRGMRFSRFSIRICSRWIWRGSAAKTRL